MSRAQHTWYHSRISDETESLKAFNQIQKHVYDLEKGRSIIFELYSLSEVRHFLLIGYHHIILDGLSLQIILREVAEIYNGNLPSDPKAQYSQLAVQEQKLQTDDIAFWKSELSNPPETLPLFPFSKRTVCISKDEAKAFRKACMNLGATGLHFHLAILQILLMCLSETNDTGLRLVNAYGPSEATVACCMGDVDYHDPDLRDANAMILVGPALPNYEVVVVSRNLEPLPLGRAGELRIAGSGVRPGYLDMEDETTYRFPMTQGLWRDHDSAMSSQLVFRTGDKARMDENGNVAILGRLDEGSQVKIRGQRVELNEISNAIIQSSLGTVERCVVVLRKDEDQILVAFVVLASGATNIDAAALQEILASVPLPTYMRLTLLLQLDWIPITSSGKADLRKLQAYKLPESTTGPRREALSSTEQAVKLIWEDTIGRTSRAISLTRSSDFFLSGGDSIRLLKVLEILRRDMNPALTLRELIENSTVGGMSALFDSPDTNRQSEIDWEAETSLPELSTAISPSHGPLITKSEGLTVLLTGATGFPGRSLLDKILQSPQISAVHCVAVRATHKLNDLEDHPKMHTHRGALVAPLLGLSSNEFTQLSETVDVIIHNGATVSFHQSYRSLAPANVILENANVALGIPIDIYRPTSITGPGAPSLDVMENVYRYSKQMHLAPKFENLDGWFDFVAVGYVAERVMERVLAPSTEGLRFKHLCGTQKITVRGLKDFIAKEEGTTIEEVGMVVWVENARRNGMDEALSEWLIQDLRRSEKQLLPWIKNGTLGGRER
ncbi:unnamed protein product [Periconia digitata]|uniref:Carrier domain-containing protein n=1 Tax=Periconia digitata TaxID=1303443 RepID=A0A9W4UN45_9PLEO|nr:unnamed protein product [Periconia digitata]